MRFGQQTTINIEVHDEIVGGGGGGVQLLYKVVGEGDL